MSSDALPTNGHYFGPTEIDGSILQQPETVDTAQAETGSDRHMADEVDSAFVSKAVANRDRAKDIESSVRWNDGRGLFDDREEKLSGALNVAYPTYLQMMHGGKPVMEELLKHPDFPDRQRKPKKGTEAVIASFSAAKPRDEKQQNECYEHAYVLVFAAMNGVEPDQFVECMKSVPFRECKREVRARRAALKPPKVQKPKSPTGSDGAPGTNADKADLSGEEADTLPVGRASEGAPAPLVLHLGQCLIVTCPKDGSGGATAYVVSEDVAGKVSADLLKYDSPAHSFHVMPATWNRLVELFNHQADKGDRRPESPTMVLTR